MTTTPTLSRATGPSPVAVAVAGTPVPATVDLLADPSRDYFPGLTAAPIDFVLLDADLLFTRPPEGAECLAEVVRRVAG